MKTRRIRLRGSIGAAVAVTLVAGTVLVGGGSGAGAAARGFDGSTIKVGGFALASNFEPGASNGAQARIKEFNDNNEIKGVEIEYVGLADDKQDPATALSEARRLVTQEQVFAIVPAASQFLPTDYLVQQKVPVFGYGFAPMYCSTKASKSVWAFGWSGCLTNTDAPIVPDGGKTTYEYVSKKTGKKNPSIAIISNDTTGGKTGTANAKVYDAKAGFKVVATNNQMPGSAVSDFTPYVQAVAKSDDGSAPDAIQCVLSIDCIPIYEQLKAGGFTGTFISPLYSDVLVKAMSGSLTSTQFVPFNQDTVGVKHLKAALDAYKPGLGAKVDTGSFSGYASVDMFIQALKIVAKGGKSKITPEAVQKAASTMTWEIKGLSGPSIYPNATVAAYPWCTGASVSNGTAWEQVVPYNCSKKQFPNTNNK
jgi:ABC-type branched-subunit amino acid transport system substrate-binding protein